MNAYTYYNNQNVYNTQHEVNLETKQGLMNYTVKIS